MVTRRLSRPADILILRHRRIAHLVERRRHHPRQVPMAECTSIVHIRAAVVMPGQDQDRILDRDLIGWRGSIVILSLPSEIAEYGSRRRSDVALEDEDILRARTLGWLRCVEVNGTNGQ